MAVWPEMDRKEAVWRVPATRMKAKREHRVPLCGRALEILDQARGLGGGPLPSRRRIGVRQRHLRRTLSHGTQRDSVARLHRFHVGFRQLSPNALTSDRCPPMLDHLAPLPSGLGASRPRALLGTVGSSSESLTYRSPNGLDHLIEDRESVQ